MIVVPVEYALEVEALEMTLIEARKKGMSRRLMKDLIDEICNGIPLKK